ncbi:hypothetical protein ACLOJK_015860 [Asimina triloba]
MENDTRDLGVAKCICGAMQDRNDYELMHALAASREILMSSSSCDVGGLDFFWIRVAYSSIKLPGNHEYLDLTQVALFK